MPDMTSTSLLAAVVSRTGKIIKNSQTVSLKEGEIYYSMVYYTLYLIVRDHVATRTKN